MQQFTWGSNRRYNDFQTSFHARFPGMKIQKISVNGSFSCPNRDGTKGNGGCIYCNNETFSPYFSTDRLSITGQLEKGIRFFSHKYPEMQYLAFFQSFTNTYAPFLELKALYEEALRYPGVVGLVIATRPDCVDPRILDYLAELSARFYVMLEFGIESHIDKTLEKLNRGHAFAESAEAILESAKRNIHTTAHLILGLPGENRTDWLSQAEIISGLPVENLKLHQLQIHNNTVMARQYAENPASFHLFTEEEYAITVIDYLEVLNPRITVERFTSQAPFGLLIAPAWGIKNHAFTAKIDHLLEERNTWQGKGYIESWELTEKP
jgi:radical SAM protein (TIGR01212 family)